jgi:hypothetical protein
MKSLDAFLTALVIIIFVLSVINTISYLRMEKNGRSDIDNDYLFGDRPNGES